MEERFAGRYAARMETPEYILLYLLFFTGSILYASVGHGGASGYLAAMALLGVSPELMKPTALCLNIIVSGIASWKYVRAGRFRWSILWPFTLASLPLAFLGGGLTIPTLYYRPVVGLVLLYAAWRMSFFEAGEEQPLRPVKMSLVLIAGAAIGFLSGLVGVGGGIFLSPLLVMLRWEHPSRVAGISALFILVNSIAGLFGYMITQSLAAHSSLLTAGIVVAVGGYLGADLGSRKLSNLAIRRLLAVVLVVAALKMFLTAGG